jgi:hypothetical protein
MNNTQNSQDKILADLAELQRLSKEIELSNRQIELDRLKLKVQAKKVELLKLQIKSLTK